MHIFNSAVLLSIAVFASAQLFEIATPVIGATLTAGVPFIVEVDQPLSPGSLQPISVAIGLQRCGSSPCPNSTNDGIFGQILHAGDYKPQRHEVFKPPYQNYSLTIDDTTSGFATLHVAHFFVIGAGATPQLAIKNVSVSIEARST